MEINDDTDLSVAVITPTTGLGVLGEAMVSVKNQSYKNFTHYIVVDGPEYLQDVFKVDAVVGAYNKKIITLPNNTGKGGYNGHRIYASFGYLLNEDIFMYLDEDNSFQVEHIESLVKLISKGKLEWAYSLRRICNHLGEFVTNDNCESLGKWPSYSGRSNVVDTNCYAITREIITKYGHFWYHQKGADRVLYNILQNVAKRFDTTTLYTVNYKLHQERMPNEVFFLQGNKFMEDKYGMPLPWQTFRTLSNKFEDDFDNGDLIEIEKIIEDKVEKGSTIMKFGVNVGDRKILRNYILVNIEHEPEFIITQGINHFCYFAPIEAGWYSLKTVVQSLLKHSPRLIVFDESPNIKLDNFKNNLEIFREHFGDVLFIKVDQIDVFNSCQVFCKKLGFCMEIFKLKDYDIAWCVKQI
jgi:hypothetical protein